MLVATGRRQEEDGDVWWSDVEEGNGRWTMERKKITQRGDGKATEKGKK